MRKPLIMTWSFTSDAAGSRLIATWGTLANAEQPTPTMLNGTVLTSVIDWPMVAGSLAARTRLEEPSERLTS